MPIYEYECDKCHRRSSILTLRVSEKVDAKCESLRRDQNASADVAIRDAAQRRGADGCAGGSHRISGDLDENDPKSVARAMRKMGHEMGDEFAGPEFDEAINEIESGGDIGDDGDIDGE